MGRRRKRANRLMPDTEIMNEPPRRLCESAVKTKASTWIMISSSSGLTIFTLKKGMFLFIAITDCTVGFENRVIDIYLVCSALMYNYSL